MKAEEKTSIILKELELLQSIIARQENARLTIRNWFIGFITALVVSYLSNSISIPTSTFLSIGTVLILMFYWTELVYRVAEKRAIVRSNEIEMQLRDMESYDGPKIGLSLGRPNRLRDQILEIPNNVRISGPYLTILILVLLIAFFHNK